MCRESTRERKDTHIKIMKLNIDVRFRVSPRLPRIIIWTLSSRVFYSCTSLLYYITHYYLRIYIFSLKTKLPLSTLLYRQWKYLYCFPKEKERKAKKKKKKSTVIYVVGTHATESMQNIFSSSDVHLIPVQTVQGLYLRVPTKSDIVEL